MILKLLALLVAFGAMLPTSYLLARSIVRKTAKIQESALSLAVFRICYSTVLLCQLAQMFYSRKLLFWPLPYIESPEMQTRYLFGAWLIAVTCILLGLFTRTAAVVNYVCTLATFSVFRDFEYHMDYVYTGVNFLLLIVPVSQRLSLDRLLTTIRLSSMTRHVNPSLHVSQLYRMLLVLVGIGFVYFDSVFFKLVSPMWRNGLGVWLPASMPNATWCDLSIVLDRHWLMIFLGYLTLIFEAVFIFIMWFRACHPILLTIGAGLHLGILIAFPIPWFALGMLSLYTLLISPRIFDWVEKKLRYSSPVLTCYFDPAIPFVRYVRHVFEHFDFRRKVVFCDLNSSTHLPKSIGNHELHPNIGMVLVDRRGTEMNASNALMRLCGAILPFQPFAILLKFSPIFRAAHKWLTTGDTKNYDVIHTIAPDDHLTSDSRDGTPIIAPFRRLLSVPAIALMTVLIFAQALSTSNSPLARTCMRRIGIPETGIQSYFRSIERVQRDCLQPIFGITAHGVFMDGHFSRPSSLGIYHIGKDGRETELPICRRNGLVYPQTSGRIWVFVTFRATVTQAAPLREYSGVERLIAFWAEKRGLDLSNSKFVVRRKYYEIPKEWSAGYLNRQMQHHWSDIAEVHWRNGVPTTTLTSDRNNRIQP